MGQMHWEKRVNQDISSKSPKGRSLVSVQILGFLLMKYCKKYIWDIGISSLGFIFIYLFIGHLVLGHVFILFAYIYLVYLFIYLFILFSLLFIYLFYLLHLCSSW